MVADHSSASQRSADHNSDVHMLYTYHVLTTVVQITVLMSSSAMITVALVTVALITKVQIPNVLEPRVSHPRTRQAAAWMQGVWSCAAAVQRKSTCMPTESTMTPMKRGFLCRPTKTLNLSGLRQLTSLKSCIPTPGERKEAEHGGQGALRT